MCWSVEVTAAMVVAGAAGTVVTRARGAAPGIWLTLGYFTVMEGLQLAGYAVIDQCGTPANRAVTWVSYIHIVFQPLFINAFAMELVPGPVRRRVRGWVFGLALLSALVMLAQIAPLPGVGTCRPGGRTGRRLAVSQHCGCCPGAAIRQNASTGRGDDHRFAAL